MVFTTFIPSLLLVLSSIPTYDAHMTVFNPAMYNFDYRAGPPDAPIGPNLEKVDDWFFRGPATRAASPEAGKVIELIAGKSVGLEIACHVAWTSFGDRTTIAGSETDACPQNTGAYHAGINPGAIDDSQISGCALAIADVDNINQVNFDNLVGFSVQEQCVKQRDTSFDIPAQMPKCKGKKCICAWLWLANDGQTNFYMTAFDCAVTPSSHTPSLPIGFPHDPCRPGTPNCNSFGAKRPLYSYNKPTNTYWTGNDDRPGYHQGWSFSNGAQSDIFVVPGGNQSLTGQSSKYLGNFQPSELSTPKSLPSSPASIPSPTLSSSHSIIASSPAVLSPASSISSSYTSVPPITSAATTAVDRQIDASVAAAPPSTVSTSCTSSHPSSSSSSTYPSSTSTTYYKTVTVTETATTTVSATSQASHESSSAVPPPAAASSASTSKNYIPPAPLPFSYPSRAVYSSNNDSALNEAVVAAEARSGSTLGAQPTLLGRPDDTATSFNSAANTVDGRFGMSMSGFITATAILLFL